LGDITGHAVVLHFDFDVEQVSGDQACDLTFTMWSAEAGGEAIAGPVRRSTWVAANGEAIVELDLEPTESAGWLETGVRCPAGAGDFETLGARTLVSGPTLRVHP